MISRSLLAFAVAAAASLSVAVYGCGSNSDTPIVDDGKRTIAMAAVDLEALGLDPSASTTGSIPVMSDGDDEPSSPSDTKPGGSVHRRKRKRR